MYSKEWPGKKVDSTFKCSVWEHVLIICLIVPKFQTQFVQKLYHKLFCSQLFHMINVLLLPLISHWQNFCYR